MVKDIVIGAVGLGFDSRASQIGHGVVNGSPPLRRFFELRNGIVQALSREDWTYRSFRISVYYRKYNEDLLVFAVPV